MRLTLQIAYNLAEALFNASGERDEHLESVIAQDTERAYWYARDVLKGPFPEAEPAIMQHSKFAVWYAQDVLKAPWLEAEPLIARDSIWAAEYSRTVLKTPEDHDRFQDVWYNLP